MFENRIKVSNKTKILSFSAVFALVGLIALYVLEFHWFQNTLNAKRLIWISLGVGFFISLGLAYLLTKNTKDSYDRLRISLMIIFIITLFSPLFGSLTNRILSFQETENQDVVFFAEKRVSDFKLVDEEKSRKGYFVFFIRNGKTERAKSSNRLFKNIEKGTSIELPIKKGLLGFEIVCLE